MKRTFDNLTKEEKQKYHIYQHWELNQAVLLSWYIAILLTVVLVACMAMFATENIIEANTYTFVCLGYMLYIAYVMMHKAKKIKKERLLIFGIGDSDNEYFFGLTKQDLKVKRKEVFREMRKTISCMEEKR